MGQVEQDEACLNLAHLVIAPNTCKVDPSNRPEIHAQASPFAIINSRMLGHAGREAHKVPGQTHLEIGP